MKLKLIYILTLIVLVLSCTLKKKDNFIEPPLFCKNELKLLNPCDTIPETNYSLFHVRDSIWNILDSIYGEINCGRSRIMVNLKIDSLHEIPLTMYIATFVNCNPPSDFDPPPFNPFVHWFHAYLNSNDTLYLRGDISSIDSIRNKIIERYNEIPPEKYSRVNIALYWDSHTNRKNFNKVIYECIKGYLEFVDSQSVTLFNKHICELDENELKIISNKIPFQLITEFFGEYDGNDFVPHIQYPPRHTNEHI